MSTPLYIPQSILKRKDLTPHEKIIFSLVNRDPMIKNVTIVYECNFGAATVARALQNLEAKGLITRTTRPSLPGEGRGLVRKIKTHL